jgi:hypothetical protein
MVEQARSDPMIAKILSPEWAAVLVVDVQNDFCHEQGAMGGHRNLQLVHRGFRCGRSEGTQGRWSIN